MEAFPEIDDKPFPVAQIAGKDGRALTEDEELKLKKDVHLVSTYKQNKLETEAKKNWDLFYRRNTTNFYKDRHWTHREFEELCFQKHGVPSDSRSILLEVGCGVGNTIFPLIEDNPDIFVYACDFSPRAVDFVKANDLYNTSRCKAFQCDITSDSLSDNVPENSVDVVTLFFVLSAIHPDKMNLAVQNIWKVIKPGGVLLFRDYGLYDHAMLRFKPGHKLAENFYVRQDGTRAYYFSTDYTESLFSSCGFDTKMNTYIHKETVNKKEGLCVPRIFVQGKYIKTTSDIT